jgi:hypothetical protein
LEAEEYFQSSAFLTNPASTELSVASGYVPLNKASDLNISITVGFSFLMRQDAAFLTM